MFTSLLVSSWISTGFLCIWVFFVWFYLAMSPCHVLLKGEIVPLSGLLFCSVQEISSQISTVNQTLWAVLWCHVSVYETSGGGALFFVCESIMAISANANYLLCPHVLIIQIPGRLTRCYRWGGHAWGVNQDRVKPVGGREGELNRNVFMWKYPRWHLSTWFCRLVTCTIIKHLMVFYLHHLHLNIEENSLHGSHTCPQSSLSLLLSTACRGWLSKILVAPCFLVFQDVWKALLWWYSNPNLSATRSLRAQTCPDVQWKSLHKQRNTVHLVKSWFQWI